MNENAPRSVCLAILMIAASALPLLDAQMDPPELRDSRDKAESPPSPCQGYDACRGTDAGNTPATAMDITDDFSFSSSVELNDYWGEATGTTSYCPTCDSNIDMYRVDMDPGFGLEVTVNWNLSGNTYDVYAFLIAIGPADTMSSYYQGSWGRVYYSMQGTVSISTDGTSTGNYPYWYPANMPGGGTPIDVAGAEVGIFIMCYYCGYASLGMSTLDYNMQIEVFEADGGVPGDTVSEITAAILDLPDAPASWSYQSGTFELDGSTTVNVDVTSCDSWCGSESTVKVTEPDGSSTTYSFANFFVGNLASYSAAGDYTLEKFDTFGDGGFGVVVGSVVGNFSGMLTGSSLDMDDLKSGFVGTNDLSDEWVIMIPDGFAANITLDWEANADLDLYAYANSDMSGLIDYSWYDQPEFIDFGAAYGGQAVFISVEFWPWGSTDPAAGYTLYLQLTPSEDPPCWVQDDAGTGGDADDIWTDGGTNITSLAVAGEQVTITGMVCAGYDPEDWYAITVPADYGVWARLDWNPTDGGATNSHFWFYMYMDIGYQSYVYGSTSTYRNPHALSTNNSYTWNSRLGEESVAVLKVQPWTIPMDWEMNYTLTFSIYDQSQEPPQSTNPNDAGLGQDAGDSTQGYDALGIQSMNQTFTGWAHDSWDRYDHYELYIPENYALSVTLTFPEENWLYLYLLTHQPPSTYLYSRCYSSYGEVQGQLSCSLMYAYGGGSAFIRVYNTMGGGPYEITMTMITPDNEPGAPHDDCGTGVDASDYVYLPPPNTWLNDSTQIDANGDANDTGGICTGWNDKVWDTNDYYNILVPAGKYLQMNASWTPQGTQYLYTYMYKCQVQTLPCSYPANPAYYVSQQYSNSGSTSGMSGLWVTQGGWLTLGIYGFGFTDLTYTLDLQFLPLADLVGGIQDDAGSGMDAGAGLADAVHVDDYNNITANNTLEFSGWNHGTIDSTDRYTFDVPINHGYEVCIEHDEVQYFATGYTVWMLLDIYVDGTYYTIAMPYYSNQVTCWDTSAAGGYYGDEVNMIGVRNWGGAFTGNEGTDYNVTISYYSLDSDGDGWYDSMENLCGTDPNDNNSVPQDTDADGICDALDSDTDGDGVIDSEDAFPEDANESTDFDGDGIGDNSDNDLDNDGWNNSDEVDCATNPLDGSDFPTDFDNDTICDLIDPDDDNDGYFDNDDRFPYNASEWADYDLDGIGDNADLDDDNDMYDDLLEIDCLSNPFDVTSIPTDLDLDGICDPMDTDVDGDGYDDVDDAFPWDPSEWADFDGDGIGDNADTDDDNDLVLDVDDAFPYDPYETVDTDGDGVGDNADLNDDGDAWTDAEEFACGSDSLDADSVPDDYDGDGLCDKVDTDDDGDGTPDVDDAFPFDATENADLDGDGVGDYSDTDDDGDGWLDSEEPNCGTDPMDPFSVPADNDRDHLCDIIDPDDDNDGTIDVDDDFPMDPNEQNDLDGDGIGNNPDNDDDGDGWLDVTEALCANADGYGDPMNADVTPRDSEPDFAAGPGEDGIWGYVIDDQGVVYNDDTIVGDGICNSLDPDDDNDGFPDPADEDNIVCNEFLCEDAFRWNPLEWHDADADGAGDNGVVLEFMDNVRAEPQPFAIAVIAIIAALAIARRVMGGDEEEDEFDMYDETDQFLEDDELEDAIEEAFDEDEDEDED